MKPIIFFKRVLPISFFTAVLLINFQNCAKPSALSGEGQTVASSPSTPSSGGGAVTSPSDVFQPATQPSNGGGGILAGFVPTCLKITNVKEIDLGYRSNGVSRDPVYIVKLSLYSIYFDRFAKGGGAERFSIINFTSGVLIFKHKDGNSYEFDYAVSNPAFPVTEAEFMVPASIYSEVDGSSPNVSGFFSGAKYENMPLPYCKK